MLELTKVVWGYFFFLFVCCVVFVLFFEFLCACAFGFVGDFLMCVFWGEVFFGVCLFGCFYYIFVLLGFLLGVW